MPRGKLSPSEKVRLRKELRSRITAGERSSIVARELAAKYRVSPAAIYWHKGRELGSHGQRETRSGAGRKSGQSVDSPSHRAAAMEEYQAEFERLLGRDLEIRKAHAENLTRIKELSHRVSRHVRLKMDSLKPLRSRLSGASQKREGPYVQSFASRLKELRKARGMTLEQVARGAGTNKGYLSWIERGKFQPPSGKFVTKIARFFSVDDRELLRLAYLEKAPPRIKQELIRALLPKR